VLVLACATFYHAPLETHADPQVTPLHTEAPWYFLWLQGMLKLGDKTFFGVVLPTVIFGVLFVVPWLDLNPHRLPTRRKGAVIIGLAFSIAMILLTYMGTPGYGIETPPAQNILSHLVPQTHPGPVRELPWEEVATGPKGARKTYVVSYDERVKSNPVYADAEFIEEISTEAEDEWHEILTEFKAEVENQPKLIPPIHGDVPLAEVTVENIQPDLKWAVFTINWDELELNLANGTPTDMIPITVAKLDLLTGEAKLDPTGRRVLTETFKVWVYDPHTDNPYVLTPVDSCPELPQVCPTKVPFAGNTVEYPAIVVEPIPGAVAAGQPIERAVERVLTLNLSDSLPNTKRSIQQVKVGLHRQSHYRH
jgi:hypothetical protein